MVKADLTLALRLALRARFPLFCLWLLVGLIALVLLAAGFSARHPATVALDVGISYVRFALPLLAILLSQELIAREFERRYCLTSLTFPRPRSSWLVGRFAAVLAVSSVLLAGFGLLLSVMVNLVGASYTQGTPVALGWPFWTTLAFMLVDLFVIGAVAMLLSVVAKTPFFVLLGCIGFLVIARSYSSVIELLRSGTDQLVEQMGGVALYRDSLPLLNFLVPDLGALDVRAISLYATWEFLPGDWYWHVAGAASYSLALLAASVWALNRRQFG